MTNKNQGFSICTIMTSVSRAMVIPDKREKKGQFLPHGEGVIPG